MDDKEKIEMIKEKVENSEEYNFLKNNKNLNNIVILGLGGSYAYGLDHEDSDIDIRGIALNPKSDILLGKDFQQVIDTNTDTTIYSLNKMIDLLSKCNPNTCEILGLEDWQYLKLSNVGKELINNKNMFLSKICINSFGNYANSQLRRLENKCSRKIEQTQRENYILKSILNARYDFSQSYAKYNEDDFIVYVSPSEKDEYDSELFVDLSLKKYPLRDINGLLGECRNIVSSYDKIGKRNKKALEHDKIQKHMAHSLRLYSMCIDLLESGKIVTYRKNTSDYKTLLDTRNGKYLNNDGLPVNEFYDIINEYEKNSIMQLKIHHCQIYQIIKE